MDLNARFDDIVAAFIGRPGVTPPSEAGGRGFGSNALRVNGSVFCMVSSFGTYVVKLPAGRIGALIADGIGGPFTAGQKSPMRQWLVLINDEPGLWESLAEEAYEFVRTAGAAPARRAGEAFVRRPRR